MSIAGLRPTNCGECGAGAEELFLYPASKALQGYAVGGLCAGCFLAAGKDEGCIVITRPRGSAEGFDGLFGAARVLLRERVADEDRIFPTLKLARQRGHRAPRILYNGVRVVEVVDDVPILERAAVSFRGSRSLLPPYSLSSFNGCLYPYKREVTVEEITDAYQRALETEGVPWGGTGGRITYDFMDWYLWIEVVRFAFGRDAETPWPPPAFVGSAVYAAFKGFSERLVIRRRGGEKNPENLIPAVVAHLLGNSPAGRKETHRLLNRHVLCEVPWKRLPEDGYANTAEVVQFWKNVRWAKELEARIQDPGPYHIK